ncbi:MAG: DUF1648 domain-containing protein [Acidobacteriota bacterium]
MRKILQAIAVLGLVFIWAETLIALYGPHHLPARIAIHFDAAGQATGWGSPAVLWFMPALVTVIYALMALVKRKPSVFNYPVRVTPATRPCLESLTCTMIAWMQAELVCLFGWIQWVTIAAARRGAGALSPWAILAGILVIWATIIVYIVSVVRTGRRGRRA